MFYTFPRGNTPDSNFRDEDMNMRVPLETASEGVKNTNKTGSKVFGFIHFAEHIKDGITNGVKKAMQELTVIKKKGRSSSGMVKTQCL